MLLDHAAAANVLHSGKIVEITLFLRLVAVVHERLHRLKIRLSLPVLQREDIVARPTKLPLGRVSAVLAHRVVLVDDPLD